MELYPYQQEGVRRLVSIMGKYPGALLADEPGVGKTPQAIELINLAKVKRALIVCPASLKLNWLREFKTWDFWGRVADVAYGSRFPRHAELAVVNYDILDRLQGAITDWAPGLVIFDESHFLKTPDAKRTRAALSIPCLRRLFMSGSPVINRPAELWTTLQAIMPGRFATFHQYGLRYCGAYMMSVKTPRGTRKVWNYSGASNLDELHQLIKPWVVRRRKVDVLPQLPPKTRQVIELTGAATQVKAEAAAWAAVCDRVGYEEAVKQLEAGAGPAFMDMARVRSELAVLKLRPALAHIEMTLESVEKVVLFAHHKTVIAGLRDALTGYGAVVLDGSTPTMSRQALVDRFQTDPACRVFIGQHQAAGVGLTLTAASLVIFVEMPWSPSDLTQCEDRLHRVGQHDTVLAQHLVLAGSLDANMVDKIIGKQRVIDAAVDGI